MRYLFSSDFGPYFSHINGETFIFEGTNKVLYMLFRILKNLVVLPNIALIVNHGSKHCTCIVKLRRADEENVKLIFMKSSQSDNRLLYVLLTFCCIKDL